MLDGLDEIEDHDTVRAVHVIQQLDGMLKGSTLLLSTRSIGFKKLGLPANIVAADVKPMEREEQDLLLQRCLERTTKATPSDRSAWVDVASRDRGMRGGSCGDAAGNARSAYRNGSDPSLRWHDVGFRPARFVT